MKILGRIVLAILMTAAAPLFAQPALPSLRVSVNYTGLRLDPGTRARVIAYVENLVPAPATNVVLTVTLPAGGTIEAVDSGTMSCTNGGSTLVCTAPSQLQAQGTPVDIIFRAHSRRNGDDMVVHATVTSAEADLDPSDNEATRNIQLVRQFTVTNVADEGSGSLRQAIHDVNALCPLGRPCAILFEIPAPVTDDGWFTIQPHTPLPEIVATVKIDGSTQTRFTGDSNPEGPEIEINGLHVREGSGLSLRPNCDVDVSHLAVNGFPGYGIVVRRLEEGDSDPCMTGDLSIYAFVNDNYLGTDPRGRVAKPNQRGLGLFTTSSAAQRNLVSGNRRSGIYVMGGIYADIGANRIGVGKDGSPLGNGAGILFDMGEPHPGNRHGANVMENVIAYNDGMAIARTRRGEVQITRNSMFDNLQQGIDVDIDGPTAQRADDTDVPNAPRLFSVSYDPGRRVTIVRGRIDSEAAASRRVLEVFSSARLSVWSTPQAEQWVGGGDLSSGHQDFEIVVPHDLRGKWVTATYTAGDFVGSASTHPAVASETHGPFHSADTSELSNAIFAQ
jgi:hypothetical protein